MVLLSREIMALATNTDVVALVEVDAASVRESRRTR